MGDVIRFPLTLRAPDRPARANDNEIAIFPFSRRRHLVEHHARMMRRLKRRELESYVTNVLERLCDELRALGIDCPDCEVNAINDFGMAIGREFIGPHFQLDENEGVAQ